MTLEKRQKIRSILGEMISPMIEAVVQNTKEGVITTWHGYTINFFDNDVFSIQRDGKELL